MALVITIIILIILATAAINFAFGNNGLITQAEKARDFYANDTKYTDDSMSNVESYIDGIIPGGSGGEEPTTPTTVAEAIEDGTKFTETTTIKDDLDNPVTIPGGFQLAEDSGTKVEEGIVIEDDTENHNQFVWIPVGEYNVTEETEKITEPDEQDGKLINELSRRNWANKDVVAEPTLVSGDSAIKPSVVDADYYGEGDSRSCTMVDGTNSIDAFKTSTTNRGGFYIGRYEQGTGNVCKAGVDAYTNVTRDTAKTQAESMYSGKTEIKAITQLISSYAWDTALNFICQTNTEEYKLATTTDETYGNIGTGHKEQTGEYIVDEKPSDKYSNIYDLLGNCNELTTEYTNGVTLRGGFYFYSSYYATDRNFTETTTSNDLVGFRVQLYM